MTEVYAAALAYLQSTGLPLVPNAEEGWIAVELSDESGAGLILQAWNDRDQAAVYVIRDGNVPPERREAVALLLTRANYGIYLGNFEMDLDDGEIRFKASVDFGGLPPGPELLEPLVPAALKAMEHFLPAIEAVEAGTAPEDALSG